MTNDLRLAARQIRKDPALTIVAVLALTIGIGLTTTVFSFVYGILHRALPFPAPDEIVHIDRTQPARGVRQMKVTIHDYEEWRATQRVFTDIAAFYWGTVNLSGDERPERYSGAFITPNTFKLLRVRPMLGRAFTEADAQPGAEPVIILSHAAWRERYDSDPRIIGRQIRANGEKATVIGVMPEKFEFPYVQKAWLPLRMNALQIPRGQGQELEVMGRLRPGVSMEEANAQMNAIARRIAQAHPETNDGVGVVVQTFIKAVAGDGGPAMLYSMLGAVFLVLLVACANVANLLLSRAAGRSREVGIRTAMGASRRRVILQFLTEALLLAVFGGLLGTALAYFGVHLFNKALSSFDGLPFFISIRLDAASLIFVLATTLVATLAAGVLPALQAGRIDVGEVLKDESRGTSSFRVGRMSRTIVVLEIAFSCGLLVAAGLMVRSVNNLRTVDYGFRTDHVFTARVALPENKYATRESQLAFFEELQTRARTLPGVVTSSAGSSVPVAAEVGTTKREAVAVEGRAYARETEYPLTGSLVVAPGYFQTFGTGPRSGRDFTTADRATTQQVALVNESFARRFFSGEDPVGRRIRLGGAASKEPWRTIVGVVPDMYISGTDNKDPDGVYVPLAQSPQRFMSIVLRTSGDPLAVTTAMRDLVLQMDADLPIYHVNSLTGAIHAETWFYRLFGSVFSVFGSVSLFLAAIGLYGVMAVSVKRRTREMGIRIALGAQVRNVVQLVLGQGFRQIAAGLGIGLALAAALSHFMSLALFQVDPQDPLVFAGVIITLSLTGLLACIVPALRATRVDPMVALRAD